MQVEGSEFILDANMVLLAIGEVPDLTILKGKNLEYEEPTSEPILFEYVDVTMFRPRKRKK